MVLREFALIVALASAGFVSLVFAESVATVPEGYVTVTIPAGGTIAAPKVSTFSVPLREKVSDSFVGISSGKITGVSSNTISSTGAGWTGNLAATGSPHFVRILNGSNSVGWTFQVSANTADVLTVVTPVDLTTLGIATSGESQGRFEIFPGDTLLSFFGNGTVDGANGTLMGGTSSANADVVRVHDGSSFRDYFFHLGNNRWQEGGFNRNTAVLSPQAGITIFRRSGLGAEFVIMGKVASTSLRVQVRNSGASYFGFPFPVDVTLANCQIQGMPGWVAATNPTDADNILVHDGAGWRTYYYHSINNRWQEGDFNRNTTNIPAGRPIWVVKKGTVSGFSPWEFTRPYSLDP